MKSNHRKLLRSNTVAIKPQFAKFYVILIYNLIFIFKSLPIFYNNLHTPVTSAASGFA